MTTYVHEGEGDLQDFKLWNLFLMKVVVNGQSSHEINVSIPKGFLFGLILLLLFVNNLPNNILRSLVNTSARFFHGLWANLQISGWPMPGSRSINRRKTVVYYSIPAKQILLMFHHQQADSIFAPILISDHILKEALCLKWT